MADTNIAQELLDAWNAVSKGLTSTQKDKLREWISPLIWQWGTLTPAERKNALVQLQEYVTELVKGKAVLLPWVKSAVDMVAEKRKKMITNYALTGVVIIGVGAVAYYMGSLR